MHTVTNHILKIAKFCFVTIPDEAYSPGFTALPAMHKKFRQFATRIFKIFNI